MHTFFSLNDEVPTTDLPIHSDEEFLEVCQYTRNALQTLKNRLAALSESVCQFPSDDAVRQFELLKQQCRDLIVNTRYHNRALFDGHINVDVVFSGDLDEKIRIRIPDLIDKLDSFHCNFDELAACDANVFAARIRSSESAALQVAAAVQGIRLNTFLPRTAQAGRLDAVNSLTGLTGLYAASYGNALAGAIPARDTGMPLENGEILINNVVVEGCDGTVLDLLCAINEGTAEHGVQAFGSAGDSLVLVACDGGRIDLSVRHQTASLLSGFALGATRIAEGSNGLLVWINFRQISEVRFESEQTGLLLTGSGCSKLALKKQAFIDLSVDSDIQRQLCLRVLAVMQTIVEREGTHLDFHIRRLQQLFSLQATSKSRYKTCSGQVSDATLPG